MLSRDEWERERERGFHSRAAVNECKEDELIRTVSLFSRAGTPVPSANLNDPEVWEKSFHSEGVKESSCRTGF